MKKIIESKKAPNPIGPYSQAVLVDNTLYVSGQIPFNAENNVLVSDTITNATIQVMKNISYILEEAGMGFSNVVKASIFVTDISKFAEVNAVYASYFTSAFPARETIQVSALPMGSIVEISVIAVK